MIKMILAVIAGFIVWTILWLGSDQVLMNASRDWYGAHQLAFETAYLNDGPFTADTTVLFLHLVRAVIFSLMAGFLAAFISGENKRAPLGLGVLLVLFGVGIQSMAWDLLPVWYHVIFLALLLPCTMLGGRLRTKL
jgi:hypothetical protein